jgi:hypothetical protein
MESKEQGAWGGESRQTYALPVQHPASRIQSSPTDLQQKAPLFCHLRLARAPVTYSLFAIASDQNSGVLYHENWDPYVGTNCKPQPQNDFRHKQKTRPDQNSQNPVSPQPFAPCSMPPAPNNLASSTKLGLFGDFPTFSLQTPGLFEKTSPFCTRELLAREAPRIQHPASRPRPQFPWGAKKAATA